MDYTDHIMLVGAGAKKFALEMGFKEQNLLTEQSRQDWLRWKSKLNSSDNWLDPVDGAPRRTHRAVGDRRRPEEDALRCTSITTRTAFRTPTARST